MRTILIQIQVPDGVNVNVTQGSQQRGGGGGGGGGTFTPQPDPDYPDEPCSVCGNDWRLIKAGFSKTKKNPDGTAKRFNAFYVCASDGCDGKPGRPSEGMEDVSTDQLPF